MYRKVVVKHSINPKHEMVNEKMLLKERCPLIRGVVKDRDNCIGVTASAVGMI